MIINEKEKSITNIDNFKNFGIELNSIAIQSMINMYTNKELAVVRELLTNAWDSHIAAGKEETPILLDVFYSDSSIFKIRDYGTGISKENMENYCTIYSSSKRSTDDQTGYFGVGSKVPFAVVDSYIVNSYFNGMRYSYIMNIADTLPKFALFDETETDETNGLEIIIPTTEQNKIDLLKKAVQTVCSTTRINVNVKCDTYVKIIPNYENNNIRIYRLEEITAKAYQAKFNNGYKYYPDSLNYTPLLIINYGNNEYKVNMPIYYKFLSEEYIYKNYNLKMNDIAKVTLFALNKLYLLNKPVAIIIDIPLTHKFTIVPSREELSLNKEDKEFIEKELFMTFYNIFSKETKLIELYNPRNNSNYLKQIKSYFYDFIIEMSSENTSTSSSFLYLNSKRFYSYDRVNYIFEDNNFRGYGYSHIFDIIQHLFKIANKLDSSTLDIVIIADKLNYGGNKTQVLNRINKSSICGKHLYVCGDKFFKLLNIAIKAFRKMYPDMIFKIRVHRFQYITNLQKPIGLDNKITGKYGRIRIKATNDYSLQTFKKIEGVENIKTVHQLKQYIKKKNIKYLIYRQNFSNVLKFLRFIKDNLCFFNPYMKKITKEAMLKYLNLPININFEDLIIVYDFSDKSLKKEVYKYLQKKIPSLSILDMEDGLPFNFSTFIYHLLNKLENQIMYTSYFTRGLRNTEIKFTDSLNPSFRYNNKNIFKLLRVFNKKEPSSKIGKEIYHTLNRFVKREIHEGYFTFVSELSGNSVISETKIKKLRAKQRKLEERLHRVNFLMYRICENSSKPYYKGVSHIADANLDINKLLKKCYLRGA